MNCKRELIFILIKIITCHGRVVYEEDFNEMDLSYWLPVPQDGNCASELLPFFLLNII